MLQSRRDGHLKNLWNQIEPPEPPVHKKKVVSIDTLKGDERQYVGPRCASLPLCCGAVWCGVRGGSPPVRGDRAFRDVLSQLTSTGVWRRVRRRLLSLHPRWRTVLVYCAEHHCMCVMCGRVGAQS